MRKFLQKTLALLVLCLVGMSAWADTVTFDLSTGLNRVKEGITVTCPHYDGSGGELYDDGTYSYIVLEAEGVNIKAVDFTGISGYGGWGTVSMKASTGEFTTETIGNYSRISWACATGTNYVKFTCGQEGDNDDFYVKTLTVTYEVAAPSTTFDFTYASPASGALAEPTTNGIYVYHNQGILTFADGKTASESGITANGSVVPFVASYDGSIWISYNVTEDGTTVVTIPEGTFVNAAGKTNTEFTLTYTLTLPSFGVSAAEWVTFCLNKAWYMPAGYTGYIVSDIVDGNAILSDAFAAGSVVPSYCPVLVNGPEVDRVIVNTYNGYPTAPSNYLYSAAAFGNNETEFTAGNMWLYMSILNGGEPCDAYLYKLSYDSEGENLGFYWDSADGQTLTCHPYRAFLVVPESKYTSSNSLKIRIADHTTGINGISTEGSNVIYNLQGQRVNTPTAGVYVKNGKKFIVK